jgi:uncharacterized protein (DUF302 family)
VASADLEAAVTRRGFGVLHVHDLGTTLRSKGIPFEEQCKVFEVCNAGQSAKVMSQLSHDPAIVQVAHEVEDKTILMVDEAK